MNTAISVERASRASGSEQRAEAAGLRTLMRDHHAEIESACLELMGAAFVDDPPSLVRRWQAFEHELLDHMAAEEELLLPSYQSADPEQAQELRADHILLRDLLEKAALDVELHTIRIPRLKDLVALLRAHAHREERSLYAWMQHRLPPGLRARLRGRIGLRRKRA
jgi:hypothetical protein